MNLPMGLITNGIDIFLLIFVRMTGLFVIAPIFGRRNIPTYMKIGFSLLLAVLLVNSVSIARVDYGNNIYLFALLVFKEVMVGITLGYVSYLVLTAILVAGQLIDMQVGFGMVSVLDPMSNISVPLTSNFYYILSMMIFLGINGHHLLISALFESYSMVPLGAAVFNAELLDNILKLFGSVFFVAFKISAPIIASILIADVALGVISKSVPQLNIFVVGMPMKIGLGVAVMLLTLPMFADVVVGLVKDMNTDMLQFMKDMAK